MWFGITQENTYVRPKTVNRGSISGLTYIILPNKVGFGQRGLFGAL